jgi:hypothetical protein
LVGFIDGHYLGGVIGRTRRICGSMAVGVGS